ncbi:MAG: cation:proton antiporter [Phycisphaerales bacterium]|nr:cation:proton antiporter [Phycisphaerales bacterium]
MSAADASKPAAAAGTMAPMHLMTQFVASAGAGAYAQDMVLILLIAGVLAVVMNRLRVATIPAYLIGGALFGPGGVGLINKDHGDSISSIAGMAIVLLMFGIGLHMELSTLRGSLKAALGATAIALTVTVLAIWPTGYMLGADTRGAIVIAIALSMSSTAVVLRLLQQRRQLGRTRGRLSMLILIGQDIAVIGVLVALPIIARIGAPAVEGQEAEAMSLMVVLKDVGLALGGIVAIFLVGKLVLPRFLAEAALMQTGEVLMVLALAFSVGAAVLTQKLGLSMELGAFLAGLMLSNTNFRHHLAGQIGTLRDLFIAVFFTTLGMKVDIAEIAANWPAILLASVLLLVIKSFGIALACWLTGAALVTALNVGIMLAQGGEFGLVLLDLSSRGEAPIITESTAARATAVIVVTLILTPFLFYVSDKIPRSAAMRRTAPWFKPKHAPATTAPSGPAPSHASPEETIVSHAPSARHVIVAGFGLVGRAVSDRLKPSGATVTVVELNPKTVRTQQSKGRSIIYGDIANPEVLETAGIHHADALILTVPDEEAVLASCRIARQINPHIFIVARTNVVSKGFLAKGLGADVAVIEELAAAETMERIVADRLKKWKDRDEAGLPPNMTNM